MNLHENPSYVRPVLAGVATLFLGWLSFVFADDVSAPVRADHPAAVLASMRQAVGHPVLSGRPAVLIIKGKVDRSGRLPWLDHIPDAFPSGKSNCSEPSPIRP